VANRKKNKLKVIPLGGLEEIGKNMTVFEYGNSMFVVDCGLAFPEDEMLGIDLVIPDISYLEKNIEKIKGIILTHGHEDHIGALPYVLKKINVPIYGTELTLGLLENKLIEHQMLDITELRIITAGQTIQLGAFKAEFIRSTHSIADCVALAIHSPVGIVLHTSDFKIDQTPIEGEPMDLARIAELGKKGVLLLMADSTNVERAGYTMSERTVGEMLDNIFKDAKSRIIAATFASNIHRIQQIVNSALKFGRKIALSGRSMINVVRTAMKLGYLYIPQDALYDIEKIQKLPDDQVLLITTGSQGEPMSALARMASATHRKVGIEKGDLVIISASSIPGNEKFVFRVINDLFKQGADVIYETLADVHVSGHASQEELKLIHRLVRPRFFMPIHGEFRHLKQHANLAQSLGMAEENIFLMENGQVLELSRRTAQIAGSVQAGSVLIDGLGIGDVSNIVLKDRKHLSEDGLIVVIVSINRNGIMLTDPEVISRGFVYVKESEPLMDEIRDITKELLMKNLTKKKNGYAAIKNSVKDELGSYLYQKTKRRPMILPVIIEIP
jgi:ribonuclease J